MILCSILHTSSHAPVSTCSADVQVLLVKLTAGGLGFVFSSRIYKLLWSVAFISDYSLEKGNFTC